MAKNHEGERLIRKVWVTLSASEFIRRMIQHIMPRQFGMIRHCGFYARNKVGKMREVFASLFECFKVIAC